ncbi:E3 ubiquitin-protein ligase ZNF598 [Hyposmocoma kahamanoa]|uniref:E3 ubiquitin-protein ligase ZNF598 n=1 Tax=Hyposmocoma kahamanoa TaxID=1477025 RepID=UPI000E6D5B1B|nr:E3 ubiquitin-protein ligase ZNF598 [Hyposmocoma kahamanoa]
MAESQSNDNNTCVLCFKNVVYYSIGECDHPVCFECSTRMRVLCLRNECPICRQNLSRVVFTESIEPYKELRNRVFTDKLFERQFKIGFYNEEIKNAYEKLLENRCKLCEKQPPFRTFSMLSDHMRKIHERFFCDLCVKHLRIFTSERKCYTRQELAHHRRKGDPDDTSHRGHPLCEFCEERFMDADELYRHLRKEHLYCHLCDADGRNLYYASYSALAHHFRTEHFLCEEGECASNQLTAVFRTEIDLKAHKATVHGRGLNRGAARQARTLELEFNITPHSAAVVQRTPRERVEEPPSPPPPPPPAPRIDTRSDEQFPRLSAAAPTQMLLQPGPNRAYAGTGRLERNDKNFPTLGGGASRPAQPPTTPRQTAPAAATVLRNSKPSGSVSIQVHSQPASASNFRLTQTSGNRVTLPPRRAPLSDDDFPSLGPASKDDHPNIGAVATQPPKVTLINTQEMQALKNNNSANSQPKKVPLNVEAFPALSSSSTPSAPPQWIKVSKSKDKSKPARPEPPPPPREPAFNQVADFPTLPVNSKPKPKKAPQQPIVQPTHQHQPIPPPETKLTKKEKRKQNNIKKENSEPTNVTYVNGITEKFTKQQMKEAYNAAMMNDSPNIEIDTKIKTIVETPSAVNADKKRNGGNGDFSFTSKDYPPLSKNSIAASSKSANALPRSAKEVLSCMPNGNTPPGFKSRPACDGMTFTNSAGQTFPAPVHTYIPPPDFEQRNRALVKKFAAALGGAAAVEDFKVASRAFRDSIISAEEFREHCAAAMGPKLDEVLPELVALLPDIAKQQELVVGRPLPELCPCAICGQLLAPTDVGAHDSAHWPPLAAH